jgi:hypothetical protein
MSKTTNYEISKQLAEIGFKQNSTIGWFTSKCGGGGRFYLSDGIKDGYTLECYSFDLETLLDALPNQFGQSFLQITMLGNQALIGYELQILIGCELQRIELSSLIDGKNESLADTAGRLIILLESKNLIKF